MRAALLRGPGRVEVDELPTPAPGDGELLLRTHRAAICGSDLHKVFAPTVHDHAATRPGYPGHEGIAEVIASRTQRFRPGDWVLAVPDDHHAGTFADLQVLPERFVVPLSADLTGDESQAERLLLAQQLGTVLYALDRFWPSAEPPATATVIGAGPAGQQFIQLLKQRGTERVIAADLVPGRLDLARRFGADQLVLAPTEDVVAATMAATAGVGADLVIEAAGRDVTRGQAMAAVRRRGRVGLFGLPEHDGPAEFPYPIMFRRQPTIEISIDTQHEPGLVSFHRAIDMIKDRRIELAGLISAHYPLTDVAKALAEAHGRDSGVIKVALTFGD